MSRIILRPIFILLLLSASVAMLAAENLTQTMQGVYNQELKAFKNRDANAFGSFYASDYVETRAGKKTGRKAFLAGVTAQMKGTDKMTGAIKVLSATVKGPHVEVHYVFDYEVTSKTKPPRTQKGREEGIEKWRKVGTTYRCFATTILKEG